MTHIHQDYLNVADATLPYTVRGSGPLLLMIPGGSGASSGFTGIADLLAEHFAVVTYDRRGSHASSPEAAQTDMRISRHSNDAQALLAVLTAEPAYVLGSSAGGLIALDLLSRYPDQVRHVVAHEPTVPGIAPVFDQSQTRYVTTYQQDGVMAALMQIAADNVVTADQPDPDVELPPTDMQSAIASADIMFTYTVPAILEYQLDIEALRAANKLTLAASIVGRDHQTPVYQCTAALAERLGQEVAIFPGHHTGNITHPHAFAERLSAILTSA